jgi:hypothetical protein
MGTPQYLLIFLYLLSLLVLFIKDGELYTPRWLLWHPSLSISFLALWAGFWPALLYWGGFFNVMSLPQYLYSAILLIPYLGMVPALLLVDFRRWGPEGEPIKVKHSFKKGLALSTIHLLLFYWGGFFT